VKYGYCLDIKFLDGDETSRNIFDAVAEAGFDYVELPLSALSALPEAKIVQLKEELKKIPCKACNLFFPPSLTLVGENMDMLGIVAYLQRMLPFAVELGVETLVFGNGGARKVPDGIARERVWANLRTIVETMDIYATKAGITIAVEPLNRTETNIINSYSEAVELTKGLKNVSAMVDSYHVAMENQSYDDVVQSPSGLKHLHTAYPLGRMVPSPADDMALYETFKKAIKATGYAGKMSIEGALRGKNADEVRLEVKSALEVVRGF